MRGRVGGVARGPLARCAGDFVADVGAGVFFLRASVADFAGAAFLRAEAFSRGAGARFAAAVFRVGDFRADAGERRAAVVFLRGAAVDRRAAPVLRFAAARFVVLLVWLRAVVFLRGAAALPDVAFFRAVVLVRAVVFFRAVFDRGALFFTAARAPRAADRFVGAARVATFRAVFFRAVFFCADFFAALFLRAALIFDASSRRWRRPMRPSES